ncbi:MAG: hypothetical protein I8H75_01015 [Myxococcaceae bacterium]|nr:hypothetical protein [Myxococcaceae bacterium]MBH2005921.1 hypothetical protein [Myxococcaceae bacterium]
MKILLWITTLALNPSVLIAAYNYGLHPYCLYDALAPTPGLKCVKVPSSAEDPVDLCLADAGNTQRCVRLHSTNDYEQVYATVLNLDGNQEYGYTRFGNQPVWNYQFQLGVSPIVFNNQEHRHQTTGLLVSSTGNGICGYQNLDQATELDDGVYDANTLPAEDCDAGSTGAAFRWATGSLQGSDPYIALTPIVERFDLGANRYTHCGSSGLINFGSICVNQSTCNKPDIYNQAPDSWCQFVDPCVNPETGERAADNGLLFDCVLGAMVMEGKANTPCTVSNHNSCLGSSCDLNTLTCR